MNKIIGGIVLNFKESLIESRNKTTNKNFISIFSIILVILNLLCIVLGIFYIKSNKNSALWNILGFCIIATLFMNFLLVYLNSLQLKGDRRIIKLTKLLGYVYLFSVMLGMLGMLIGNVTLSNSYSSDFNENIYLHFTIYFSYMSIFLIGIIISFINYRDLSFYNNLVINEGKLVKFFKGITKLVCYLILIFGIFSTYVILSEHDVGNSEVFISEFTVFYGLIFFSATIVILNLKNRDRCKLSYWLVVIIGISISFICILPLILTPYAINRADKNFSEAFGSNWGDKIEYNLEKHFLNTPFIIPAYFLGMESKEYTFKKDILFYQGKDSKGKEIKLYFDAYMPNNKDKYLPGTGSTVIRIHGGAWVSGDKGKLNMLQMNKYLAEKGYTVFDIQYGLSNNSRFTMDLGEPENVRGNFDIDHMVKHIGMFTKYISEHADEYNANLNSVFISGGSAGGHLACATALAVDSGKYNNIFSSKIKIKGLIPFYPANGLPDQGKIYGNKNFMNPKLLVKKDSPPCLIYQGTKDGLVPRKVSIEFKNEYISKGNNRCAILWMPLGSHASDYYFPGQYNQIFLYYMERFMYIYK